MTRFDKEAQAYRKRSAWWPVMGFFFAISFAILSYFLGPELMRFIGRTFSVPELRGGTVEMQWIFRVIMFVTLLMILGAVYAAAAPKDKIRISEKELVKQREQIHKDEKARRERIRNFKKLEAEDRRRQAKKRR